MKLRDGAERIRELKRVARRVEARDVCPYCGRQPGLKTLFLPLKEEDRHGLCVRCGEFRAFEVADGVGEEKMKERWSPLIRDAGKRGPWDS